MNPDLVTFVAGLLVGFVFAYLGNLFNLWVNNRLGMGGVGFKARTHRPETPEGRIDAAAKKVEASWSEQTIEEGMRQMRDWYRAEGQQVPNDTDLRLEVEQMLNASVQGESAVD